jgi:DNA-binding transcriptional regulator YdaS (Cro superfamily)
MQFLISGGFWTLNSAFFILATSTVAAEVGKIFNIAGTSYSTTSHTIAVNGVVEPPGAGAGAQGGGPPQRVHIGNVGSFYNVSGSYDFGAVWARALSVNELALLTRDPYQLFRPLQRRIYVSVAGGGQTIAVGQVTETDLAQAIAWAPKRRLVNQVSETDLAQAMGRLKTRAVGQVSETDLAQAITWAPKNRLVNQVTETDLAQAMGRLKSRTIGQVSETDLAQVVSPTAGEQVIQVGQVSETDLAQAMGRLKTRAVGQVSETDLARGIARLKAKTIGQISETDLAQPIAWAPKKRLVGQVTETDIAFPITVVSTAAPAAGIDPSPLFIADVGKTVGM